MSPPAPSELVISDDPANRTLTAVISPDHLAPPVPGPSADQPSWAGLIRHARCADAGLDPDQWFPVSTEAAKARHEAAAAIAICGSCLVRAGCLALSLRHWDIGQHGVWGPGHRRPRPAAPPDRRGPLPMRQRADARYGRRIGEVMMSREQAARRPGRAAAATRGQLRIYLGSAPGAGTTCAMLSEAHRRAERGTDVVVADAKTRGRPRTAALLAGLEVISPAQARFRGTLVQELDLDAVLARRPQVALLDELAHANAPGLRHATRWQDAGELLGAGIDVVCTVEVRQRDSLHDVAEKITGAPPSQTVPDAVVRAADEIQIVDTAPEALRDRMAHGDIYPAGQAQAALAGWFRIGNLSALRELALLWLAATLAEDRHRYRPGNPLPGAPQAREKVVVALPGGPDGERLIRRAARITTRTAGDLLAVHVTRPGGPAGPGRTAALTAQRRLVSSAGGTYHQLSDDDIPVALLTFARAENATQLCSAPPAAPGGRPCCPGPRSGPGSCAPRPESTCTSSPAPRYPGTICPPRPHPNRDRTAMRTQQHRCCPGGARQPASAPMQALMSVSVR